MVKKECEREGPSSGDGIEEMEVERRRGREEMGESRPDVRCAYWLLVGTYLSCGATS